MRFIKLYQSAQRVAFLLGTGLVIPTPVHATFSGSDDFSKLTEYWNRWNYDGGSLSIVDGKAVFTSAKPAGVNDQSQWQWAKNTGSADENWSLQIDSIVAPASGVSAYTSSWLTVYKRNEPTIPYSDTFRIGVRGDGYVYADFWHEYGYTGGFGWVPTTSNSVALGIEYNAASHTLTAAFDEDGAANGYNFQPLLSVSGIKWNSNDPFEPLVGSQAGNFGSGSFAVTSGIMSFDNFQTSSKALPTGPTPIPEPGTFALLTFSLAGLWFSHRKQ